MTKVKKFAVLIDADNSSQSTIEPILEEIAKYGIASVKRIYGDWSAESLKGWRDKLLPNAITPVQQFAYVAKKDATDMKLVIDAMDLLYAGELDGFCIISSDSDFTPLASRIRESGLLCYGFGEKKTVSSFINACDKFIYVENLLPEQKIEPKIVEKIDKPVQKEIKKSEPTPQPVIKTPTPTPINDNIEVDIATLNLLYKAIKDNSDDVEGWANLGSVGSYINNVRPDFDTRSYGKQKLSEFLKSIPVLETKIEGSKMSVRKFQFMPLNKCVQGILENKQMLNAGGGWAFVSDIAHHIFKNKRKELKLKQLSSEDIEAKIQCIHPNWVDFSKDKKKVRNISSFKTTEKNSSTTVSDKIKPLKTNTAQKKITGCIEPELFFRLIYQYSSEYSEWIPINVITKKLNNIKCNIPLWSNSLQTNITVPLEKLKQTDIISEIKNLSPKYITLDEKEQCFKPNQRPQ